MNEPDLKIVDAREDHTHLITLCVIVAWPNPDKSFNLWLQILPQLMFGLSWFEGETPLGRKYWSAKMSFAMFNFSVSRNK